MFFDLFAAAAAEGGDRPTDVGRRFAAVVEQSAFQLWRPGQPIPRHSVRLLIGVATGSGYDMRLLDVIEERMGRGPSALPQVDVFDVADCPRPEDFQRYIPTLRDVSETPVAGIWFGGQLTWRGQGQPARDQIARMFGAASNQIVEYVRQWTENRTPPEGARR
jgi:hypothetical protein